MAAFTLMSVLGLLAAAWEGMAQIVSLDGVTVPQAQTLNAYYMFFVEAGNDEEQPYVEFRDLGLRARGQGKASGGLSGVAVALLPRQHFWQLLGSDFCSGDQLQLRKHKDDSPEKLGASVEYLPSRSSRSSPVTRHEIPKPGVYVLAVTNCGNASAAAIGGSVIVRNTYGFLPGNEYARMRFFGWLSLVYGLVCSGWLAAAWRHHASLEYVHTALTVVVLLCFAEALCCWLLYLDWNSTGSRHWLLNSVALQLNALRPLCAWRSLLLLCQEEDGQQLQLPWNFYALAAFFVLQQCVWRLVVGFRFSHGLHTTPLLSLALGSLAYAGVFLWSFAALAQHIGRLEQLNGSPVAFVRLSGSLQTALLLAIVAILLQAVDLLHGGLFTWGQQWLPTDGVPSAAFLVTLLSAMATWWPASPCAEAKGGHFVQVGQDESSENAVEPEAIGAAMDGASSV